MKNYIKPKFNFSSAIEELDIICASMPGEEPSIDIDYTDTNQNDID